MNHEPCGTCGSITYYRWQKVGNFESCNDCARIADNSPRDAIGQKVRVPNEHLGKYSYAIGEVIHSERQYAEVLRKNNLGLKNA